MEAALLVASFESAVLDTAAAAARKHLASTGERLGYTWEASVVAAFAALEMVGAVEAACCCSLSVAEVSAETPNRS